MKSLFLITLLIIAISTHNYAQEFARYFTDGSLRVDYMHTANDKIEIISLDELYHEPYWGGSQINLIDTFNYGNYKIEVIDSNSNTLIYSRGYSSLCAEWIFTPEAKTTSRSFSESVVMPFPKNKVKILFYKRQKNQTWQSIFQLIVDPKSYSIIPQQKTKIKSFNIHNSGKSSEKLDLVILAEGYTEGEMQKFMNDAIRFKDTLLSWKPFKQYVNQLNFWVVPTPSPESGTDIPGEGVFVNTIFDSHFYTFGTERYLNTTNNVAVRNAASNAPYDQIYILVNTAKYGGAGIYNYYSICTADHPNSGFVFAHEFGHAFAGLADEYYTSEVAVDGIYDLSVEPWEPNISTLVNFDQKWKALVTPQTPVPTPASETNKNIVGAFEGGGYLAKGIFRPSLDCSMKSIIHNQFCPVCSKAIQDRIKFYLH